MTDPFTEQVVRVLALARSKGASIRALARLLGVSKSTMGRWMPGIDALASQIGRGAAEKAADSEEACPIRDSGR
jgi:transposase